MEAFLKTFSLSFLLRSVCAGGFFVVAQFVAVNGYSVESVTGNDILKVALPVSFFAGIITYALHRSLVYPLIEWRACSIAARETRRNWPLISKDACESLKGRWVDNRGDRVSIIAERTSSWADFAHLLYVSALCIVFGGMTGAVVSGNWQLNWPLAILTGILATGGWVSDWRLRSFLDSQALTHTGEERVMCKGLTNKGEPCGNRAGDTGFCHTHAPKPLGSELVLGDAFQMYRGMFDTSVKFAVSNAAITAVVIGWSIWSETARKNLANEHGTPLATVMMIAYLILYCSWFFGFRSRSQQLHDVLVSFGVEPRLLQPNLVSPSFFLSVVAIQGFMTALIIIVIANAVNAIGVSWWP